MTAYKPKSETFKDFVGEVKALRPRPARLPVAVEDPAPVLVRPQRTAPEFVVETDDDWVLGHAVDVPARLAHDLRNGPLVPYRTLDLHRLTATQANEALDSALLQARRDAIRCLVVVHGKGTHSGRGGPVLHDVVLSAITSRLAASVLAFRSAPPSFGGSGALLVRLR